MFEASVSESISLLSARRVPNGVAKPDEGIPEETKDQYRKRWFSLTIAYIIAFMLGLQESIYWVSLWPFLSEIDSEATEDFFGYIIMAFNLGCAVTGPIFGLAVNKFRQTRLPIAAGICLTIVGNMMVGFVEAFPNNRRFALLAGRFVTGMGIGTEGSIFAYITMASKPSERNRAVSIRAAIMSSTILLGPLMQTICVPIGYPAVSKGAFHFNMYTAPAFVNVVIGVVQVVIILTLFREFWVSVSQSEMQSPSDQPKTWLKSYDKVALGVSMYVRFVQMFCLVYPTSVNSPFTMANFGWSASDTVLYNGIIMLVMGALDSAGNLFVGHVVLKYVEERKLILVGISMFTLYFLISFAWPGLPPLIEKASSATDFANLTATVPSAISSTGRNATCCNYSWCAYTTRIYLWQLLVAFIFFVASISLAFTPNATLFSKVVGPRKQGTIQGLFYASGQVAATICPPIVSNLFLYYGPRAVWGLGLAFLASVICVVSLSYRRLLPWTPDDPEECEALLENSFDLKHASYSSVENRRSTANSANQN